MDFINKIVIFQKLYKGIIENETLSNIERKKSLSLSFWSLKGRVPIELLTKTFLKLQITTNLK